MFSIDENKTIHITRGDVATIIVSANLQDGSPYSFRPGDVVRFKVFKAKDCSCVILHEDVTLEAESQTATIRLTKEDTTIGDIISKPADYWYEIEINPDSEPQTIVGYDALGAKIFRLYPEGSDPV